MGIRAITKGIDGNLGQKLAPKNLLMQARKAQITRKYNKITNGIGLKTTPELVFSDMNVDSPIALYDTFKGKIDFNTRWLRPFKMSMEFLQSLALDGKKEAASFTFNGVLKHELTHFDQFSSIARSEEHGIDALKALTVKLYKHQTAYIQANIEELAQEIDSSTKMIPTITNKKELKALKRTIKEAKTLLRQQKSVFEDIKKTLENPSDFNSTFYKKIIDKLGTINSDSEHIQEIKKFVSAYNDSIYSVKHRNDLIKLQKTLELTNADIDEIYTDEYLDNFLESKAREASSLSIQELKKIFLSNKS